MNKKIPIEKRTDDLTILWNEFKNERWPMDLIFTNGDNIYIQTVTVGTALFFKRGFKLQEIDGEHMEEVFKEECVKDVYIADIRYILTLLNGMGIDKININEVKTGGICIRTDDVSIIIFGDKIVSDDDSVEEEPESEEDTLPEETEESVDEEERAGTGIEYEC